MLRCLNNNFLTRKFVSNYGKLAESHFIKDIKDKKIRLEILDYFNITKDFEFLMVHKVEFVKIHIMDYLELLEIGLPAPQFHIKQLPLSKGFVFLETPRFIYLLRLILELKLIAKIKSMKVYTDNKLINECVRELQQSHPIPKQNLQMIEDNGQAPCIKNLIQIAKTQNHLGHNARILLGNYLMGKGFDMEYILDIYSKLSDYSQRTTENQLKSIQKYNCYSCQSCETMGLCVGKDKRCSQISNPFFY
jgi:DNA primase large subunit